MPKWRRNADEDEEEDHTEQQQQQRTGMQLQPPKKITKNISGQVRNYHFLKTVKSVEELDNIRYKNYCHFICGKPLQIWKSLIIPCRKKRFGKTCDFELVALSSEDLKKRGEIHVYAHSQHNHPFAAEEKRLLHKNWDNFMPYANPSMIFGTPDNIEWRFLQTFPDYEKMQKFRYKHQCKFISEREKSLRYRFFCKRRYHKNNCKFMVLAMKTTKHGYHVYKHGEHNHHPVNTPRRQQPALGKSKQQMEDKDEQEKDEEDGDGDDQDEAITMEDEEENKDEEGNNDEEEEESEECHDEDEEAEEQQEEAIEEEEDDDIIVLENEDEEQQKGEEKEGDQSMEIEIIEIKPRKETLKIKLENANEKVYKWMAGIELKDIGGTLGDWDKLSLLKMVEMADQEIREHPQKLNLWLPWMKCAIPKCLPQIEEFNVRFGDLLKLVCI